MNHAHKSWEPPMLLLFFLFGLGVWNRAGVCFLLLAAASFALWKVRFSPSEVLLLAFSLSYFVADMCDCGLSLRSCMLYLIGPWAAYRLGRCYALEAGSPRSFEALLAAPSLGMALHGLLNWLACLLWQGETLPGRTAVDIWRGAPVSVTCTGMLLTAAAALSLGVLAAPGPRGTKWAARICLAACQGESVYFPNRTLPLQCILLLAARALGWLLHPGISGGKKLRRCCLFGFAACLLILILQTDFWGLRHWLAALPLFLRLQHQETGLSRPEIWLSFFQDGRWLRFPLGGNRLTQDLPFSWFHNLWLDLYNQGGLLPFLLFSLFTLRELFHSTKFFLHKKAGQWERASILAAHLLPALWLNAMVEPVMEANVYVFLSLLLFLGAMRGHALRSPREPAPFGRKQSTEPTSFLPGKEAPRL